MFQTTGRAQALELFEIAPTKDNGLRALIEAIRKEVSPTLADEMCANLGIIPGLSRNKS